MTETFPIKVIARIRSDFSEKFGIPRQAGLVEEATARIVFEEEYRNPDALRGLSGYSHIWLIWQFSKAIREDWSPTVRPPRLGGNTRMGVFATRSPFRPNPIGLSCVKLLSIDETEDCGTVLTVAGADLLDGTPIFDIKPYLPYTDSHPDALSGFALQEKEGSLTVDFPEHLLNLIPQEKRKALFALLKKDPRPGYQSDERPYGMMYAGFNVRFTVKENTLYVFEVEQKSTKQGTV